MLIGPSLRSWLEVSPESDFPIQNLPLGRAKVSDGDPEWVSRLGDQVILAERLLPKLIAPDSPTGFQVMRERLVAVLAEGAMDQDRVLPFLTHVKDVELVLPIRPTNFVDFYSGIHHASNVGRMFRPDQPPLLPNYRYLPVGYNGRASSVAVSGTAVRRPWVQRRDGTEDPVFEPTRELDFELELGVWIGKASALGEPVAIDEVERHVLGVGLVNDWSARDGQRWEYQPLGPFLAKSFATSVSPWIVSLDALEPFRVPGMAQDPAPFSHLRQPEKAHFAIDLSVGLRPKGATAVTPISITNTSELYWSLAQQLAHLTSNGANIEQGDLIASGTISGSTPGTFGSLLELTWRGSRSIDLPGGFRRTYLEDGDEVVLTGSADAGSYRIGLGKVSGTVLAAHQTFPAGGRR